VSWFYVLSDVFGIGIILCCIGMITGMYQDCKENRFGDGYFMMIVCVFPLALMLAVIWYLWYIHIGSPLK